MGHVPERLVLEVPIEGEHFLIDVGDKQVLIAAPEDIGRVDAHPGARLPRLAEAYLGRQRDLFELPLTNFAGPAVPQQQLLHRILGDKQRSEEHTSELQSHLNLVCRLLLEKKKKGLLEEHVQNRPHIAKLDEHLLCDLSPLTNDSVTH